jgi:2-oxoglutarate dehydrogenase E2 component (dihydrolipoamide succinyltransferase)
MSSFEIKMPKLGESITEGTIISWFVKVGDTINEDDVLFEVSTAKVNAEIPSPVAGTISKLLFKEGDTVPVGETVAIVNLGGDAAEEPDPVTAVNNEIQAGPANVADETKTDVEIPKTKPAKEESRWYSPVVRELAKQANLTEEELEKIPGTGYQGRLSKKDMVSYIEQVKKGAPAPKPEAAKKPQAAEMLSVNPVKSSVTQSSNGNDQIIEMDTIRRITSDRMILSKKTSAHVTTVIEVDVTKLVNWRNKQKESFMKREGISLTFMPSIVEATSKALIDFPQINASVEGYNVIVKKNINIGIAVALDDGNLIVPVVHNADKLSISGIAHSIDTLAAKARSNKLSLNEIQGGTFTITNFGSFKNILGTPIINQPEVAILGVGFIEKKPAVIETPEGDVIAIRHKMYLSLSYDHRIINGAVGGAFVKRIADYLENWEG